MKIYGTTEYIKNPEIGDLKLEVNCQWDFKARTVCTQRIRNHIIGYDLKECIKINGNVTTWKLAEITDEIKKQLIEDGYNI